MSDEEIYQKFIEYMNNPVWKFTESVHKMPMITSFISPEEAEFLTGFPMGPKTLEEIAALKDMKIDDLTRKVKVLCEKGLIYESIREGSVRYKLWTTPEAFLRVPFWAGTDGEPLKTMARHGNKYFMDGWWDQRRPFVHPELRSIPIHETVVAPTEFLPFEDIIQVVDKYEYYSVSHCPCKMRYNMDPDYTQSGFPTEVCLHFNALGHYCVENGLGREITKEETLDILKKAADAGLVHGIANHEENPETICNCDPEYCNYFKSYHQMGFDKSIDPSNYQVAVSVEACKACGLCVKRCPMDAILLKFSPQATNKFKKAPVVDLDICIGCGVCVHKCKSNAIHLERKEVITKPPKTERELMEINAMASLAAQGGNEQ
jgi:Na+-translocating ferredoxin:NAD+ oxidoreductase subunit B